MKRVAGNVQFWFLLLCAFSIAICTGGGKHVIWLIALTLWCVLIIVFVIGNMSSEMQLRLYEPPVFITASMLYFVSFRNPATGKTAGLPAKLFLTMVVLLSAIYAIRHYRAEYKANDLQIAVNKEFLDRVNALQQYKYVFYAGDADLFNYMDNVFRNEKMFGKKTVLTAGFVQYSYSEQFKKMAKENTGCSVYEFSCLFEFLEKNKFQTIIVGSERMMAFYKYYLKEMYGVDFNYAPTETVHRHSSDRAFIIE